MTLTQKNVLAIILTTLAALTLLFAFSPVSATSHDLDVNCAGFDPTDPFGIECGRATGLSPSDPRLVIGRIINVALSLLGIVATVLIVYAGFKWMTAGGNEENVKSAQKILMAAVIGLVIILAAYAISNFVLRSLYQATAGGAYPG